MAPFIAAADPASKVARAFNTPEMLHNAIKEFGFIPLRRDGSAFFVNEFEGGYLLDGAPIPLWLGMPWLEGQREMLQPHWDSGAIPRPPAELLNAPVGEWPEEVRANYERWKASQGISWVWIAAGLGLLFLLMPRGRGSRTWD
jgi:hypothetical protein